MMMNDRIHKDCVRRQRMVAPAPLTLAVALALASLASSDARAIDLSTDTIDISLDTTVSYGINWRVEERDDGLIGKAYFDPTLAAQAAALQAQNLYPESQQLQANARGRFSVNSDDGDLNYDKGDVFSNAFKVTSELSVRSGDWGGFARASYFYDFENVDRNDLADLAKEKIGEDFQLLDFFVFHDFHYGDAGYGTVRLGRQVVSWGESTFIQNGINIINPIDVSRLRVAGAELKEAFLPIDSVWGSFSLTENLSLEAIYMFEFEQTEPDPAGAYFSTNDLAVLGSSYVMLNFGTVPQPVDNPDLFWNTCYGSGATDLDLPPALVRAGCSAAVPRAPDRYPSDSGQYGAALRYFAEGLNNTEFGFYYLNYHSRLPLLSGISIASAAPSSARYFAEYPEDIHLWGISFNTNLPGGWAWQGEMSYRPNAPLQIDDVELLFSALSPLNPLVPQPYLRFISQLGEYGPGEYIRGWERHEVGQLQSTFTKVFGPGNFFGADQISLVGEIGATRIWDLPALSVLRYQADGTDTGGGPDISSGAGRNPFTQQGGFATPFSWGYRVAARADYNNVWGTAFNVSPRVAFNHDVNGTSPGPGGNFIEDRKSLTLGAEAVYLNKWSFDLAYTQFSGAGPFNLISDRDFASFTIKYSF